jgi:hypothetical protein
MALRAYRFRRYRAYAFFSVARCCSEDKWEVSKHILDLTPEEPRGTKKKKKKKKGIYEYQPIKEP